MGFFTDTSICIGCKACEVACKEWNQLQGDSPAFPADSFPHLPPMEGKTNFALPGGLLKEMIRKTVVVSSGGAGGLQTYEEVLVEGNKGELCFVATDSVRLGKTASERGRTAPCGCFCLEHPPHRGMYCDM